MKQLFLYFLHKDSVKGKLLTICGATRSNVLLQTYNFATKLSKHLYGLSTIKSNIATHFGCIENNVTALQA